MIVQTDESSSAAWKWPVTVQKRCQQAGRSRRTVQTTICGSSWNFKFTPMIVVSFDRACSHSMSFSWDNIFTRLGHPFTITFYNLPFFCYWVITSDADTMNLWPWPLTFQRSKVPRAILRGATFLSGLNIVMNTFICQKSSKTDRNTDYMQ